MADARAALGFAAELAGCAGGAEFASGLQGLTDLIGAEAVIVTSSFDWMAEVKIEVGDPGIYRLEVLEAIDRDWRDHPVIVPDLARPGEGARRVSDFVADREWRRRALFNEFYRPLGMTRELSVQLAWGPVGTSCCVALHRSGRDFDERERGLLELIAPHLRAVRSRVEAKAPVPADCPSAAEMALRLPITLREADVLARLAAGRTNEGIAQDLGISRHTVVRHVENIYAKLGVHSRVAATRLALGHGDLRHRG